MGFPTRFVRSVLGPLLRDLYPPENTETDIGARTFNTVFWQVAGMNLVSPRASLVASWNGSAFTYTHQHEAWNAENAQAHPQLTRQSTGRYRYTFAASYLDENGSAIATVLGPPRITPHSPVSAWASQLYPYAWIDPGSPLVVEISIWNFAGAATDAPFWLEVL
jgi:hypothetical protein